MLGGTHEVMGLGIGSTWHGDTNFNVDFFKLAEHSRLFTGGEVACG